MASGRLFRPAVALLLVHGALSGRPETSHNGPAVNGLQKVVRPHVASSPPPKRRTTSMLAVTDGFANATGMPAWATRAAAWPLVMNPGVALSFAAVDFAASSLASNSSSAAHRPEHYFLTQLGATVVFPFEDEIEGKLSAWLSKWTNWQEGKQDACHSFSCGFGLFAPAIMWVLQVSLAVYFAASCVTACCHQFFVNSRRRDFPSTVREDLSHKNVPHDFSYWLFSCCSPSTIGYALFCPAVRHADTLSAADLMEYWYVFLLWTGIEVAFFTACLFYEMLEHDPTVPALLRSLAFAAIFMPKRQELRLRFGAPDKGDGLWDCVQWVLCQPCVVAQEGREVDRASGVYVACCCRKRDHKYPIVGKATRGSPF